MKMGQGVVVRVVGRVRLKRKGALYRRRSSMFKKAFNGIDVSVAVLTVLVH